MLCIHGSDPRSEDVLSPARSIHGLRQHVRAEREVSPQEILRLRKRCGWRQGDVIETWSITLNQADRMPKGAKHQVSR